MAGYRLTSPALRDLASIIRYLYMEAGAEVARRTEDQLAATMELLVQQTSLGHRKPEFTQKQVLFHTFYPYVLIFERQTSELLVHEIIHGARDIAAILRRRSI